MCQSDTQTNLLEANQPENQLWVFVVPFTSFANIRQKFAKIGFYQVELRASNEISEDTQTTTIEVLNTPEIQEIIMNTTPPGYTMKELIVVNSFPRKLTYSFNFKCHIFLTRCVPDKQMEQSMQFVLSVEMQTKNLVI